jgi:hypothetical protein
VGTSGLTLGKHTLLAFRALIETGINLSLHLKKSFWNYIETYVGNVFIAIIAKNKVTWLM